MVSIGSVAGGMCISLSTGAIAGLRKKQRESRWVTKDWRRPVVRTKSCRMEPGRTREVRADGPGPPLEMRWEMGPAVCKGQNG